MRPAPPSGVGPHNHYVHLTFRAMRLPAKLTDHAVASWLWSRLEDAFPDALAAVLMPNHGHLLAPTADAAASRRRLASILSGLRRSHHAGARIEWEPARVEPADPDPQKLARLVRYIALNPMRAGLSDDPLRWAWSTHREVIGATATPWVTTARLSRALGRGERGFARWLHAYVSADPSVHVAGTPLPRAAAPSPVTIAPLEAILAAAVAATRAVVDDVRAPGATRRLFLELARDQGFRAVGLLAAICATVPRSVYGNLGHDDPAALAAARLCLGDERLRSHLAGAIPPFFSQITRPQAR